MTSESLLSPVLLELLERATNRYLALSPDYQVVFKPLFGRVIAVHLTGIEQAIYIIPGPQGLQLADTYYESAETTLRGSPLAFLGLAIKSTSPVSMLFSGRLELAGDLSLGQAFQRAISQLNFPWEEHLSRYIGLNNSYRLVDLIRSGLNWQRFAVQELEQDLAEYLQEEIQLAVAPRQAEGFFNDVDALRNQLDHLEIRIQQLEQLAAQN